MKRWLEAPHVRRWWGDPEHRRREIVAHLGNPLVRPYVVELAGRPFAYLQCYDLCDYPDSARRAELRPLRSRAWPIAGPAGTV